MRYFFLHINEKKLIQNKKGLPKQIIIHVDISDFETCVV